MKQVNLLIKNTINLKYLLSVSYWIQYLSLTYNNKVFILSESLVMNITFLKSHASSSITIVKIILEDHNCCTDNFFRKIGKH